MPCMARVLIAAVTTVALLAMTTGAAGGGALVGPAEAQLVSSTGPGRGVAENFHGVYTTADDGAHWVSVTPPSLRANPILLDHVFGIASFGADRVWLLVSANAGYGTRLVYTWDGGRSWRVTPLVPGPSGAPLSFLPGDANPTTSAFSSADDGWIMAGLGPRDRGGLFRTRDGGARWSFVADAPFQGSVVFTNQTDGWGVSAPTWTNAGTVKTPGGVLYQSTDGGVAWRRVQLPPISAYRRARVTFGLPTFFGASDGVVAGRLYDTRTGAEPVVVYTTNDDGATWHGRLAPQTTATRRYQQGSFTAPFAAASPTDWAMYAGTTLYTTADAGLKWTSIHPKLPKTVVAVDRLDSARPNAMWAQAHGHIGNFYPPYLIRSVNGGRTWNMLSP